MPAVGFGKAPGASQELLIPLRPLPVAIPGMLDAARCFETPCSGPAPDFATKRLIRASAGSQKALGGDTSVNSKTPFFIMSM